MKFWDLPGDNGHATGARVSVNGEEKRLAAWRVRLLQRFPAFSRDESGKRIRASAELTPEEVDDLRRFGIRFEPAAKPGWYYLDSEVEIGKFYRHGYSRADC